MKKPSVLAIIIIFLAEILANSCIDGWRSVFDDITKAPDEPTAHAHFSLLGKVNPLWEKYGYTEAISNLESQKNVLFRSPELTQYTKKEQTERERISVFSTDNKDAYFDSNFDGIWSGYVIVAYDMSKNEYLLFPMHISINVQEKNHVAVIRICDVLNSVKKKSMQWHVVTTTDLTIQNNDTTLILNFDTKNYPKWFKNEERMKGTITVDYYNDYFGGSFSDIKKWLPEGWAHFWRLDKDLSARSLWSAGIMIDVRVEENVNKIYMPTFLSFNQFDSQVQGYLAMAFWARETTNDSKCENNVVSGRFDLEPMIYGHYAEFKMTLNGGKLKGYIKDLTNNETINAEFLRAGCEGKIPRVKRVKPKRIKISTLNPLRSNDSLAKMTIIGKNFVPGAMIYFDNPQFELQSIDKITKTKIIVSIKAVKAIPKGTEVGIRVVNPDNLMGTKNKAFIAK